MCAWVLFANLQANLSPFRCIPQYVTLRDVERNNCSLEQVYTRGCGYARLGIWSTISLEASFLVTERATVTHA